MRAGQRCHYPRDLKDLGTIVLDGHQWITIWDKHEAGYPLDIAENGDDYPLVDTPPEDFRRNAQNAWRRFHKSMAKFDRVLEEMERKHAQK